MTITEEQNREVQLVTVDKDQLVHTYSLVLSAANIPHRIKRVTPQLNEIVVFDEFKEQAEQELRAYELENSDWPPTVRTDRYHPDFRAMSVIVAGFLAYIFGQTGDWHHENFWFFHGAGNSTLILQGGEYHRLLTALTLHADLVHLLSNCILGGFVVHFFFGIVGNGIGLLMVFLTGTLANYLNVLAHGGDHNFVGFSTSIFSVIGMLCTINFIDRKGRPLHHMLMPLMSGLALLAFLGSSGPRTDLGGHFFGLVTGLICGNLIRFKVFYKLRSNRLLQWTAGSFTLGALYLAWRLAFNE